jgi:hypothetical protein
MREPRIECGEKKTCLCVPTQKWRNFLLLAVTGFVVLFGFGNPAHAVGFFDTGSMGTARQSHTATRLNDGSVLITGGWSGSGAAFDTAELYNPDNGTFTPITAHMNAARRDHTATLLSNGKVLIAGGFGSPALSSAEIYDPQYKTFTSTGSMGTGRWGHTATLLSNGKVLITGGRSSSSGSTTLITAVLYDPAGSFAVTGSMKAYRTNHTATLLSDNRVLIVGGFVNNITQPINATNTAEIFDAAGVSSTATLTTMATARGYHAAVLLKKTNPLQEDTVLITGGSSYSSPNNSNSVSLSTAEFFAPSSGGSFSSAGSMVYPHSSHTATVLTSGRVLIAGSMDRQFKDGNLNPNSKTYGDTDLYIPTAPPGNRFSAELAMTTPRANYPAVLLANGTVLLAGGATPDSTTSTAAAVIYNPADISVTPAGYTFPDTFVNGTPSAKTFTIRNADPGNSLPVSVIEISGTDSAVFAWSSSGTGSCGTPPFTIPASGSCTVSVTFAPTSATPKSASLDITSEDQEIQTWSVPLKGTGIAPPNSTVTVTFAATGGPGAGSVHSSSVPAPVLPLQEISCTGGAGILCQGVFKNGTTTIALSATPDSSTSTFGDWTGTGCTVTPGTPQECVINNLSGDTAVTATFVYIGVAKIDRTQVPYGTLQSAYNAALTGDEIRVRALTSTEPTVLFNNSNTITIEGGYDTSYSTTSDYSVLDGVLQISNGRVNVKKLIIR